VEIFIREITGLYHSLDSPAAINYYQPWMGLSIISVWAFDFGLNSQREIESSRMFT
jgi:hypothetical protein